MRVASGLIISMLDHCRIGSIIMLLTLVLLLTLTPVAIASDTTIITTESELRYAVQQPHHDQTLIVDGVVNITDYIPIRSRITIGGSGTITVSDAHRHFHVGHNGELTLTGEVTLTRAADYSGLGGGIAVNGGVLNINGGAIVNNHAISGAGGWVHYSGGGIFVFNNGLVTMRNGRISDNTAQHGGGLAVANAQFTMSGGIIDNNHATISGGGVSLMPDDTYGFFCTFHMYGGQISNNSAAFNGGGIYSFWGSLRLQNGEISSNTASGHGGIFITTYTILRTGANIRIINNSPINAHDTQPTFFAWFITPDIYRFVAVFVLAIIGTVYTLKKQPATDSKKPSTTV